MNILVTGGLGTVGKPLVESLRSQGHTVWIADKMLSAEPNYVKCDIAEFRQVQELFSQEQFHYVYHLAAEFGRQNGEDYYDTLWKTNAIGTKNIIRMQERFKFKMIFTSSSEVYGDYPDMMSEIVMDAYPIKQLNDYAMTKWVNEMQILNSAKEFKTQTVRVRLFNTYGVGEYYSEYRSAICVFIYKALHDLPYTVYTKHMRTSSYIDDTVNALTAIVENFKAGEVYNIAGTRLHSMKEASDIILSYLGKNDSKVKYKELQPRTTLTKQVDISKAVKELGLKSTISLEDGILRTINWQRGVYKIG